MFILDTEGKRKSWPFW